MKDNNLSIANLICAKDSAEMRKIMKNSDKNKPIHTMPKGIWESSRPVPDKEKSGTATESTDLQGNGYPKKESR